MVVLNLKYLGLRNNLVLASTLIVLLSGCDNFAYQESDSELAGKGVLESRAGFKTFLIKKGSDSFELEAPDVNFVSLVTAVPLTYHIKIN